MANRILILGIDDEGNILWIENRPVPDKGMIRIDHGMMIADLEEIAIHARTPTPEERRVLEPILKKAK